MTGLPHTFCCEAASRAGLELRRGLPRSWRAWLEAAVAAMAALTRAWPGDLASPLARLPAVQDAWP